jgi:flagellar biosynthetic protein FliQ
MFWMFILAGPWMLQVIVDYTTRLFQSIPQAVG